MVEAYLELGTNLGDREAYLAGALEILEHTPGIRLVRMSRVYHSAAWGMLDQPDFLNLCVQIETSLEPVALLRVCKQIEADLGRKPRKRWGPREIDADILLMEGVEMETPELTIPHPRLSLRRFVLEPLSELVPDWELDGIPVRILAASLKEDAPEQVCEPDSAATRRLSDLRLGNN